MRIIVWTVRVIVAIFVLLTPVVTSAQIIEPEHNMKIVGKKYQMTIGVDVLGLHQSEANTYETQETNISGLRFGYKTHLNYFFEIRQGARYSTRVNFGRHRLGTPKGWSQVGDDIHTYRIQTASNVSEEIRHSSTEFKVVQNVHLSHWLRLYAGLSSYRTSYSSEAEYLDFESHSKSDISTNYIGPVIGFGLQLTDARTRVGTSLEFGGMSAKGEYNFVYSAPDILPTPYQVKKSMPAKQLTWTTSVAYQVHSKLDIEGGFFHHRVNMPEAWLENPFGFKYSTKTSRTGLTIGIRIRP